MHGGPWTWSSCGEGGAGRGRVGSDLLYKHQLVEIPMVFRGWNLIRWWEQEATELLECLYTFCWVIFLEKNISKTLVNDIFLPQETTYLMFYNLDNSSLLLEASTSCIYITHMKHVTEPQKTHLQESNDLFSRRKSRPTWRITPVSKWLVTPIYKLFRPFVRGTTPVRGLTNHGY